MPTCQRSLATPPSSKSNSRSVAEVAKYFLMLCFFLQGVGWNYTFTYCMYAVCTVRICTSDDALFKFLPMRIIYSIYYLNSNPLVVMVTSIHMYIYHTPYSDIQPIPDEGLRSVSARADHIAHTQSQGLPIAVPDRLPDGGQKRG